VAAPSAALGPMEAPAPHLRPRRRAGLRPTPDATASQPHGITRLAPAGRWVARARP